jgi:hypothetical protein
MLRKNQEAYIPFAYTDNLTHAAPFLFFNHCIYFAKKILLNAGSACVQDVGKNLKLRTVCILVNLMSQIINDNVQYTIQHFRLIKVMRAVDGLVFAGTFLDTCNVTQQVNRYLIYPTNNIPYILCT